MEHHHISAERLTVARLGEILERRLPVALSDDARARIVRCREYLDRKMEHPERPIYGITTGFGSLCDISVGRDEPGAVAEEPRHVARLRYGRARTVGDRAADPAAEDPVAFVRPFGRAVGHRGAARGVLQPGDSPRRLPAGVARRFGRPGAAGPHEPAAAGTGRSGVRGAGAPGLGGTRRAGVETPRATVEGGAGAAQRHAVHGGPTASGRFWPRAV